MTVVVITPPAPLLDIAFAKQHLRVDGSGEDGLITAYIAAASAMIDGPAGWLGRCIGSQTLELQLDGFTQPIWGWAGDGAGLFWNASPALGASFPLLTIRLPYPPLIAVASVTYEDAAGIVTTLPSAEYLASDDSIDASFGTTFPAGRWEPGAVKIRYTAGYTETPAPIAAALLLMVGDLYSNRQTVETGIRAAAVEVPMSTTVQALLSPFRVYG